MTLLRLNAIVKRFGAVEAVRNYRARFKQLIASRIVCVTSSSVEASVSTLSCLASSSASGAW